MLIEKSREKDHAHIMFYRIWKRGETRILSVVLYSEKGRVMPHFEGSDWSKG